MVERRKGHIREKIENFPETRDFNWLKTQVFESLDSGDEILSMERGHLSAFKTST